VWKSESSTPAIKGVHQQMQERSGDARLWKLAGQVEMAGTIIA
jgi:hypothetical protein